MAARFLDPNLITDNASDSDEDEGQGDDDGDGDDGGEVMRII